MTSDFDDLAEPYYELSALYKNPTKLLNGKAAANCDAQLAAAHKRLLERFEEGRAARAGLKKDALYYKALALLYEVDDYRGVPSFVGDLIKKEWRSILSELKRLDAADKRSEEAVRRAPNFKSPKIRSLWSAKVLCGVAAVEVRRKSSPLDALLAELAALEAFVEDSLHVVRPAWTMLAFVRAAQARVARQNQQYNYVQETLLSVVHCLDERAAEIIKELTPLEALAEKTKEQEEEIEALTDDLMFIMQKQTLSSLFNVGLANLQRGFLDSADYACQAARLQFRRHGQFLHRMYNELAILSIKRARTSTDNKKELCDLRDELAQVIPLLKPTEDSGNPKLYLYALREMAVLQLLCGETEKILETLETMGGSKYLSSQWHSRINILRARYCYRRWNNSDENSRDDDLLEEALAHSEAAFKDATGLREGIESQPDTKELLDRIRRSGNKSLLDTIESLVTYGTVQNFLLNHSEAIKSARAVVELSMSDNPRLLAMGYLVLAEAYLLQDSYIEAHRHLASAKSLESQIDHKYVEDRRVAVEKKMPEYLDLTGCKSIEQAEELLKGWFIDRRSRKTNVNQVAEELGWDWRTVNSYLNKLSKPENRHSPFRHLLKILRNTRGRGKDGPNPQP
jgi:hypothetical protein